MPLIALSMTVNKNTNRISIRLAPKDGSVVKKRNTFTLSEKVHVIKVYNNWPQTGPNKRTNAAVASFFNEMFSLNISEACSLLD
jgi:hypothetical protein